MKLYGDEQKKAANWQREGKISLKINFMPFYVV